MVQPAPESRRSALKKAGVAAGAAATVFLLGGRKASASPLSTVEVEKLRDGTATTEEVALWFNVDPSQVTKVATDFGELLPVVCSIDIEEATCNQRSQRCCRYHIEWPEV